jgi:hypothetical protein
MGNRRRQSQSRDNLLLALCLVTLFAGVTAASSAYISSYVLDQLQSGEALAMIVTDGGIRSDSRDLERNMSSATSALMSLRDFSLALSVGCVGIVLALGVRHWRSGKG